MSARTLAALTAAVLVLGACSISGAGPAPTSRTTAVPGASTATSSTPSMEAAGLGSAAPATHTAPASTSAAPTVTGTPFDAGKGVVLRLPDGWELDETETDEYGSKTHIFTHSDLDFPGFQLTLGEADDDDDPLMLCGMLSGATSAGMQEFGTVTLRPSTRLGDNAHQCGFDLDAEDESLEVRVLVVVGSTTTATSIALLPVTIPGVRQGAVKNLNAESAGMQQQLLTVVP